jgi:hypothetical protein
MVSRRRPAARRPAARRGVSLLLAAAAACARGESQTADSAGIAAAGRARGEVVAVARDVADPGVRPTQPAYRVAPAPDAGAVTGTVVLDGPAPADTAVAPGPALARRCGASLVDRTLEVRPNAAGDTTAAGVAGAVVWLEGVAAGKRFRPAGATSSRSTAVGSRPRTSP